MSATVYYRPIKPQDDPHLHTVAPSHFIGTIEETFGQLPVELDQSCIKQLNAMIVMCGQKDNAKPYVQLVDAIAKYGKVEVYARY